MKINATIARVEDEVEEWNDFYIVVGHFEDGSKFKVWGKDKYRANNTRSELASMAGTAGEFEIDETKTKIYKGKEEYRLKGWPGKPQRQPFGGGGYGGGGGKPGYQPRYRDTPEGTRAEQDSIHRSVALTQAVAARDTVVNVDELLKMADRFYDWLSQGQQAPSPDQQPPQTQPSIGTYDPLKEQKEFFGQPAKSPTVEKYLSEIDLAVQKKDADRLKKLGEMATDSLRLNRLTKTDIDTFIDPAITKARAALKSASEVDSW